MERIQLSIMDGSKSQNRQSEMVTALVGKPKASLSKIAAEKYFDQLGYTLVDKGWNIFESHGQGEDPFMVVCRMLRIKTNSKSVKLDANFIQSNENGSTAVMVVRSNYRKFYMIPNQWIIRNAQKDTKITWGVSIFQAKHGEQYYLALGYGYCTERFAPFLKWTEHIPSGQVFDHVLKPLS